METCIPLALKCVKSVTIKPDDVFTIVDYGCADGGTSMPLLYRCVQELKKMHGPKLAIHVTYEDQPVNDFKALFLRLQGLIPGPKSFYLDFTNVYVTACGTSFYKQCVPSGSVMMGFSSTAMHFLSQKPCDITGALHHTMITEPGEAQKFREQAERDWETILLKRAEELAPGGGMVIVHSAIDNEGQFIGKSRNIKESMHHKLCEFWKGMVEDCTITQDEFQRTTLVNYYRTVKELKKPFESQESPVRKAGLSLISIETKLVRCPYNEKWIKEGGDPKAHAQWYIPTTRTWSNHTFMSSLSDSRTPEEKTTIVDEFFRRYEVEVSQNPADHGIDYVQAFLLIEKNK